LSVKTAKAREGERERLNQRNRAPKGAKHIEDAEKGKGIEGEKD